MYVFKWLTVELPYKTKQTPDQFDHLYGSIQLFDMD